MSWSHWACEWVYMHVSNAVMTPEPQCPSVWMFLYYALGFWFTCFLYKWWKCLLMCHALLSMLFLHGFSVLPAVVRLCLLCVLSVPGCCSPFWSPLHFLIQSLFAFVFFFSDSLLFPSFCFSRYQLCKYSFLFVSNMAALPSLHLAPLILETCAWVLQPFVWLVIWDTCCWLLLDWAEISKTYLYIKAVCAQTSALCLPHWPLLCFVWEGKQKYISVSWGFISIFWVFFFIWQHLQGLFIWSYDLFLNIPIQFKFV